MLSQDLLVLYTATPLFISLEKQSGPHQKRYLDLSLQAHTLNKTLHISSRQSSVLGHSPHMRIYYP